MLPFSVHHVKYNSVLMAILVSIFVEDLSLCITMIETYSLSLRSSQYTRLSAEETSPFNTTCACTKARVTITA